jgi:hypothetical protein
MKKLRLSRLQGTPSLSVMAKFDGMGALGVVELLKPGPVKDWKEFFVDTFSLLCKTFNSGEGMPADLLLSSAVGMQEDLEQVIKITPEKVTPELLRQFLPMEKFPFLRLKQHTDTASGLAVRLLPRESILRQCYQIIFLVLLRRYIPKKCEFYSSSMYSLFLTPFLFPPTLLFHQMSPSTNSSRLIPSSSTALGRSRNT